MSGDGEKKKGFMSPEKIMVLFYIAVWYAGNILYIKYNKEATVAFTAIPKVCPAKFLKNGACSAKPDQMVDGAPDVTTWGMSVATGQLVVGVVYALYLWVAPDCRKAPKISSGDFLKMVPAGVCSAMAHASSVLALSVGGVAFGSIVKAAEPVFAAAVNAIVYQKGVSQGKIACMIPIVGGIAIASLKFKTLFEPEIDDKFFSLWGLIFACAANIFAAFKGSESAKIKNDTAIQGRLGCEANSFAVFSIISLLTSIPLMIYTITTGPAVALGGPEGLYKTVTSGKNTLASLLLSGMMFYIYNEAVFMMNKSHANPEGVDATTSSVLNTAKRVITIAYGSLMAHKIKDAVIFNMSMPQVVGCSVCIAGVFLYSVVDDLLKPKAKKA